MAFKLGLAGAARAYAASCARHLVPESFKAWNLIPVLCKLDLQLGFRGNGAPFEYLHYNERPVPDSERSKLLQVAFLRRRKKIIHDKMRDAERHSILLYLKSLARA